MADQFGRICIDNPIPTPGAMPLGAPKPAPAAIPAPPPIPVRAVRPALSARLARDGQSSKVVIKDHQYNPVRNLLFKIRTHLKIINLNIVASHISSLNSQFHRLIVVHPILSSYIIVND